MLRVFWCLFWMSLELCCCLCAVSAAWEVCGFGETLLYYTAPPPSPIPTPAHLWLEVENAFLQQKYIGCPLLFDKQRNIVISCTQTLPLCNLHSNMGWGRLDSKQLYSQSISLQKRDYGCYREFTIKAYNLHHNIVGLLKMWIWKLHYLSLNPAPLSNNCGMLS